MGVQDVEVIDYSPEYGIEVVRIWRQSFQRAMNLPEQNRSDDLLRQLDYFSLIDPISVLIAIDALSSVIARFMVFAPKALEHFYVNVVYQGMGVGSTVLNQAKALSSLRIALYTF